MPKQDHNSPAPDMDPEAYVEAVTGGLVALTNRLANGDATALPRLLKDLGTLPPALLALEARMDGEFDDLMATLGASNTISRSFERAGAVLAPGNPQPAQELHDQAWAAVTIGIDVLDRNEGWDFLTFGGKTEFHARYARLADDGITATDCLLRMMKDGDGADLEEDDGQHLAELAAMSALDLAERLNEHAHAAVYRVLIQHIRSWCDHLTFGPVDMVALRQVAAGLNAVEADRANP